MKSLVSIALSSLLTVSTLAAFNANPAPSTGASSKSTPKSVAVLIPTQDHEARGVVYFEQTENGGVEIVGRVENLSPGKHGFHVHEFGDLTKVDGTSAGGHFNPDGHEHGAPDDEKHHAGDFGNIEADDNGIALVKMTAKDLDLQSIIGRALVVHAGADDLTSQPSGDAGPRAALGVIGFANTDQ